MVNAKTPTFDNSEIWHSLTAGISSLNLLVLLYTYSWITSFNYTINCILVLVLCNLSSRIEQSNHQENRVPSSFMLAMLQGNQTPEIMGKHPKFVP